MIGEIQGIDMDRKMIVEYAERWATGGIEAYIVNLVKLIDRNKYEVKVVTAQKETDIYDQELLQYGVQIESINQEIQSNPIKRMIANGKPFKEYFRDNSCDVLHLHICQGVAMRYAKVAKAIGIPHVITHCHNTEFGDGSRALKWVGHTLGKKLYKSYPNTLIACSDLAAKWLYPRKLVESGNVIIAKYIVDVEKFKFSEERRLELRKSFNIDTSQRVYLNIGRLNYQKNQKFLLDVFDKILKEETNSVLVLIGAGELKEKIHEYARALDIYHQIIFVDKTRDIASYMSMSDIFLLPSLFEGNPVVGTEAQANGLPCVFSDSITKQAKVLDSTSFLSLSESDSIWACHVREVPLKDFDNRKQSVEILKQNGYDIERQILDIEKVYGE